MKKRNFYTVLLAAAFFSFSAFYSTSSCFAKEYIFSVLPRYYPEKLTAMTAPLIEHLKKELNADVSLRLTENFADYKHQVLDGTIAIGLENPLVYVSLCEKHEVIATAVHGEGKNMFRGIVITNAASKIASLEDLKGKEVMIVGRASAGGYLSQKSSLREIGIDVEKECRIIEASANRQENVIIAVSIGDVDAGFIHEGAYHLADEYIRPNSIKKVIDTAWLPNWAFSVSKEMPKETKDKLRKIVTSLPKDGLVLKALEIDGFAPAKDTDYDSISSLLE